ncbi:cuticle collagen 2C-like [Mesoplodon densirostris]|uniref:cuticle collagen 2C-like n=1 Tax=Mesoplodon densirostris TaxID=48708 RepID=UPI0028DBD98F|nr:cuticle collagen 2C-like [Mesoplodon densirostris]
MASAGWALGRGRRRGPAGRGSSRSCLAGGGGGGGTRGREREGARRGREGGRSGEPGAAPPRAARHGPLPPPPPAPAASPAAPLPPPPDPRAPGRRRLRRRTRMDAASSCRPGACGPTGAAEPRPWSGVCDGLFVGVTGPRELVRGEEGASAPEAFSFYRARRPPSTGSSFQDPGACASPPSGGR